LEIDGSQSEIGDQINNNEEQEVPLIDNRVGGHNSTLTMNNEALSNQLESNTSNPAIEKVPAKNTIVFNSKNIKQIINRSEAWSKGPFQYKCQMKDGSTIDITNMNDMEEDRILQRHIQAYNRSIRYQSRSTDN